MKKIIPITLMFGCLCFFSTPLRAGIIFEPVIDVTTGTLISTITASNATGYVLVDGTQINMPAGGGKIQLTVPGSAGAVAGVDLATQKTYAGALVYSDSGESAKAVADITKTVAIVATTYVVFTVDWIAYQDPDEIDDFYFAPGVDGSISEELGLYDLLASTSRYDQTSTINSSGGVTGPISYTQAPGVSDGLPGIGTAGIADPVSNNRWLSDPWNLSLYSNGYTLGSGGALNLSMDFTVTSTLDQTSGSGLMGDSIIPEPSAWMLLASGLGAIALARARLNKRRRT